MATLLVKQYCSNLQKDNASVNDHIVTICAAYIGRKGHVISCSSCSRVQLLSFFSISQKRKRLPQCKTCTALLGIKKKVAKTANKPVSISIEQCQQALMACFDPSIASLAVIVANLILGYSHILIEGIYRFGHESDEEWRRLKNQSEQAYHMHRLVLKPSGMFRWEYAQYQQADFYEDSLYIYDAHRRMMAAAHVANFEARGGYHVSLGDDIGGKTELSLKSSYGSWQCSNFGEIAVVVDCDRDLVMTLRNKDAFDHKAPRSIQDGFGRLRDATMDKSPFLRLQKRIHSVWVIPP